MLIYYLEGYQNVLLMLNAIYSRCIVQICIIHLFGMILPKEQWKNSLRWLLALPKHNSASEMFVNLNII